MKRNKFLKNCLIITIIIFIIMIGLIKHMPIPEIKLSPYILIISGILSILIIIFSINLYKISHDGKVNLIKVPPVEKIYEIKTVIDCLYIHKSNLKKGFRIIAQMLDESLKPIDNEVFLHVWFRIEHLNEKGEPKKDGYFITKMDPNIEIVGPVFFEPYYGKKIT